MFIILVYNMNYHDAVMHSDINHADNVHKDPERVRRLMRFYVRNQSGQASNSVLAQDIAANDETPKGAGGHTAVPTALTLCQLAT